MTLHKVRLVMSGPGRGELFIDDQKIQGVKHVKIDCGVDQMNHVTATFATAQIEVEGEFDVTTIGHDGVKEFAVKAVSGTLE